MENDKKKTPKEESDLFHNIMKASVSNPKHKEVVEKIKSAVSELYPTDTKSSTTVSAIVRQVMKKYPGTNEAEIKESLGNMDGWERVEGGLEDRAEISPSFFE